MKKLTLFGLVFLALALIISPAIARELPACDHIGNFEMVAIKDIKMAIIDSQPGDNIGFLIRGISKEELKSLSDGGDNVCMLIKSISKDKLNGDENSILVLDSLNRHALDAFIHSTTKYKLNGDEIGGRKIVVNKISGEQNCIPILSNRMLHGTDTNVEEIELAVEKIERA